MIKLDDLDDIAELTNFGGRPRRNCLFGWTAQPNIARASVAREKPQPAPRQTALPPPHERAKHTGAGLGRIITSYRSMIDVCRDRANELQISRLEIDRLAGLPDGYAAKILGKDEGTPRKKRLWPVALETMLATLGLRILLIEDEAATARTLALRTPVDVDKQRFGNKSNSKPLLTTDNTGQISAA